MQLNFKTDQLYSLLRTVLTFLGALLTGGGIHYFFGHVVDTAYWEEITGVVISLVSLILSVRSKEVDVEKQAGAVRHVLTFICGIVTARNLITAQQSMAIITFAAAMIPWIQAGIARKKNQQLFTGKIQVEDLKSADVKKP